MPLAYHDNIYGDTAALNNVGASWANSMAAVQALKLREQQNLHQQALEDAQLQLQRDQFAENIRQHNEAFGVTKAESAAKIPNIRASTGEIEEKTAGMKGSRIQSDEDAARAGTIGFLQSAQQALPYANANPEYLTKIAKTVGRVSNMPPSMLTPPMGAPMEGPMEGPTMNPDFQAFAQMLEPLVQAALAGQKTQQGENVPAGAVHGMAPTLIGYGQRAIMPGGNVESGNTNPMIGIAQGRLDLAQQTAEQKQNDLYSRLVEHFMSIISSNPVAGATTDMATAYAQAQRMATAAMGGQMGQPIQAPGLGGGGGMAPGTSFDAGKYKVKVK